MKYEMKNENENENNSMCVNQKYIRLLVVNENVMWRSFMIPSHYIIMYYNYGCTVVGLYICDDPS